MLSRRALFLGCLVLATGAATAAQPTDPKAHMTQLYARVTAGKGTAGGQQYWGDPKARRRWFSAAVVKLWGDAEAKAKAMDDVGPIDFDLFTNSQDPQVQSATVDLLEQGDATAKLRVTLAGPGYGNDADKALVFDLVREGDGWKIDDVWGSVAGDAWHLRDLLTQR